MLLVVTRQHVAAVLIHTIREPLRWKQAETSSPLSTHGKKEQKNKRKTVSAHDKRRNRESGGMTHCDRKVYFFYAAIMEPTFNLSDTPQVNSWIECSLPTNESELVGASWN